MQDILTQALGIKPPWFLKNVEFNNKQLDIYIDFKKGTGWIDSKGTDSKGSDSKDTKAYSAYDSKLKKYRQMDFFEYECYLHIKVPRIKRDDGKVQMILPPFADELNGFTPLF